MARITVEDCIDKFPSRFELVLVASNRARKLHSGENPTVERDNDKNTVIALREIAQETLTIDQLKNDLIEEYQTVSFNEDEDLIEDNSDDENLNETLSEEETLDSTTSEEKSLDEGTFEESADPEISNAQNTDENIQNEDNTDASLESKEENL